MSVTPDTSTGSNARERSTLKASTLCEAFQVTAAEKLTATMKLKRKPIAQKYSDEIAALYA